MMNPPTRPAGAICDSDGKAAINVMNHNKPSPPNIFSTIPSFSLVWCCYFLGGDGWEGRWSLRRREWSMHVNKKCFLQKAFSEKSV